MHPKELKRVCLYENVLTNIHGPVTHNSQTMVTTQTSFIGSMNKQNVV